MFDTQAGWGMLLLRIPTGIIFMAHGLPKTGWFGERTFASTVTFVEGLGFPLPTLFAGLVTGAEALGGLLLILGLATRPAALTQVVAMLVAIFMVHLQAGMFGPGGYQWALLLGACSATLMIEGAGKISLDKLIADRMGDG